MNRLLTRYRLSFKADGRNSIPLGHSCGVTAYDFVVALKLIKDRPFIGAELPELSVCVVNIDVSTLDENHILPNIGLTHCRGIWFPNLNVVLEIENLRF